MEGKLLQRRRNLDMIAMDLKAIWEMSVKSKLPRKRHLARIDHTC